MHKEIPRLGCGKEWKTGESIGKSGATGMHKGFSHGLSYLFLGRGVCAWCSSHNSLCLFVALKYLTVSLI